VLDVSAASNRSGGAKASRREGIGVAAAGVCGEKKKKKSENENEARGEEKRDLHVKKK